jgi:nitroreductase
MDVKEAINKRRAFRCLLPFEVTDELVNDLAESAHFAPSCMNNQSWRFVFVYESDQLERMQEALSKGNAWAKNASLMVVVFSRRKFDCMLKEREYFLFDTGLATAFMMLRATELDLVAHPIAGYKPDMVKEILGIPDDFIVIAMVIFGRHTDEISPHLMDWQVEREKGPRVRRPLETVLHHNSYDPEQEPKEEEK